MPWGAFIPGVVFVSTHFEWMRIALAMGLMLVGFILLPVYFLWKDNRDDERNGIER